ncbi:oxidoreductase [Terrihabitans soli]|uniref:Oxidoreductase n=1 Tax=Terrihabitans soli TaxID=708113 RepID=A0A6S6QTG5_9HYPH|nr:NAD(P)H-dependent oxidoreductase [Terrihabitans soli]BCJ92389.1 oxidoreductase [Terrihabitans soli]
MSEPKLLVFAGSVRTGSLNETLASFVVRRLTARAAHVSHISLTDYDMPLYNGDREKADGPPENAKKLCALFYEHQGIFIAGPEYNAGITPLTKNTIDWISRVEKGAVFRSRAFALGGASDGRLGAYRSLMATRQVLELGCNAFVQPEMISVPQASKAYDANGDLVDAALKSADRCLDALIANAKRYVS